MASPSEKLSWKTRLLAWWEGYDLAALQEDARQARSRAVDKLSPTLERKPAPEAASAHWSASRIDVVEMAWGKGFNTPGGDDHIPMLIKPLGTGVTVLDLGAGLGGVAKLIAQTNNAWVTGLEDDPVLAAAGKERITRAGLEKRVTIQQADLDAFEPDKRYDAVFSKETFFQIRHKDVLFGAIQRGLKPRGQLLFTDYVLKHSASTGDILTRWREGEEREVHPWTISQVVDYLKQNRFDIRITEDITEAHRTVVVTAWDHMIQTLVERPPADAATQQMIVREAELWKRRVAAMDTGDLRVYRFSALAPTDE